MSRQIMIVALLMLALWSGVAEARDFPAQCSSDAPRWLFLIDRTDAYDDIDKSRLSNGAAALFEQLGQRARQSPNGLQFEVYGISDRPGSLQAEWRTCVPACRLSDGDQDCDDVLMRRDSKVFHGTYIRTLAPFVRDPSVTDGSEILRSLYILSNEFAGAKVEKLIIFSDLIEYSDLSRKVSHFAEKDGRALFRQIHNKRLTPPPTFKGADVVVFGTGKRLGQDSKEQRDGKGMVLDTGAAEAFRGFWTEYFSRVLQAGSVRIKHEYVE